MHDKHSDLFIVAVSLIVEHQGTVLLMRRSAASAHGAGEWEFPSGRLQQGETLEQAVLREGMEETALDLAVEGLFDTFQFRRGAGREHAVGITFHCRLVSGEVRLSPEHDDFVWQPLDRPLQVDLPPAVKRSYEKFALAHSAAAPSP